MATCQKCNEELPEGAKACSCGHRAERVFFRSYGTGLPCPHCNGYNVEQRVDWVVKLMPIKVLLGMLMVMLVFAARIDPTRDTTPADLMRYVQVAFGLLALGLLLFVLPWEINKVSRECPDCGHRWAV